MFMVITKISKYELSDQDTNKAVGGRSIVKNDGFHYGTGRFANILLANDPITEKDRRFANILLTNDPITEKDQIVTDVSENKR